MIRPSPPQDLQGLPLYEPSPLQVPQDIFPFRQRVQRLQPSPPQGRQATWPAPWQCAQSFR